MKKINIVKKIVAGVGCFVFFASVGHADGCDTCQQFSTLNTTAEKMEGDTATTSSTLDTLLQRITLALFGTLPALGNGNVMAAFSILPTMQSDNYDTQKDILNKLETGYQGSTNSNSTLTDNYRQIFGDYLLQEEDSVANFDEKKASIASLYLDPAETSFYSEEQQAAAETYIKLVSGTAASNMHKPSSDWLTISSAHESRDKKNIRHTVSSYYTFSALQSAIADNFAYLYSLNKGEKIVGTLSDYAGTSISQNGLLRYIQTQKTENPEWYSQIGGMGMVGLLKEQTILMGGCFMMLSRIESDLRRILVTTSVQATIGLIGTQQLTEKLNQAAL